MDSFTILHWAINNSIVESGRHLNQFRTVSIESLKKKMKLETTIYLLVLCECAWSIEIGDLQRMSLASDRPSNATTLIRYKRYLDFIPKSRMFVSLMGMKCS